MRIYKSVTELIGKTPIIEAVNTEKKSAQRQTSLQSLSTLIHPEALRTELQDQ